MYGVLYIDLLPLLLGPSTCRLALPSLAEATMLVLLWCALIGKGLVRRYQTPSRLLVTKVFQVFMVVPMSVHHESTNRFSVLWLRLRMASSVRQPAYTYLVQGARVVSRCTKLFIYDGLGQARVYTENEMVYGKVSIRFPGFHGMASACALGPWQCLPGPVFHPRNFNKNMAWGRV